MASSSGPQRVPFPWAYYALILIGLVCVDAMFVDATRELDSRERLLVFCAALGQTLAFLALFVGIQIKARSRGARLAVSGLAMFYTVACWLDYGTFLRNHYHSFRFFYDQLAPSREGVRNVITIIERTGIPPLVSGAIWAFFLSTPLYGILLHRLSERLDGHWPVAPRPRLVAAVGGIGIAMMLLPYALTHGLQRYTFLRGQDKAMPFPVQFFRPPPGIAKIPDRIHPLRAPADVSRHLESLRLPPGPRFPIFLFVFESLREDYLTEDVAPTIAAFRKNSLHAQRTSAAANGTVPAMYGMLHANEGLYWLAEKEADEGKGSAPLRLLKRLGYRISTGGMIWTDELDHLFFGREGALRDRKVTLLTDAPQAEIDGDLMRKLAAMTEGVTPTSAELYFAFLNTTHFPYYWPKTFPMKFTPVLGDLFYMIDESSEQLDRGKNRYRNAIRYGDSLLAEFFETIRKRGVWDDSLIVVAADHGEELWDHGLIGHTSELCNAQTLIPVYYKFPKKFLPPGKPGNLGTAIDVMPTILAALGVDTEGADLFDGRPAWKGGDRMPVTIFHNSFRPPVELTLRNADFKLFLMRDKKHLEDVYVERITDAEDKPFIPGRGDPDDYLKFATDRFALSRHPLFRAR